MTQAAKHGPEQFLPAPVDAASGTPRRIEVGDHIHLSPATGANYRIIVSVTGRDADRYQGKIATFVGPQDHGGMKLEAFRVGDLVEFEVAQMVVPERR
jgi:hypothetical protein